MKDINITFANYYPGNVLLQAIASLVADIHDCPYTVAIVVADNSGNRDHIRETLLGQFPQVEFIDCGGNIGCGQGANKGFHSVPARYYLNLNGDIAIPENTRVIERMIRLMDEHPRIGCMGPKLLNTDGSVQYSCYRFDARSMFVKPLRHLAWDQKYAWVKTLTDRLLMKDFDHKKTQPVDWVLGAAMLVRREVVEQVGWFDPRYFLYLEDADWCRSMWAHGWPVYYVHDIEIIHSYARDSAKVPGLRALIKNPLARIHAKSLIKFFWKWRKQFRLYDA